MITNLIYNKSLPIAAVGPSIWTKLGPEKWFDKYKVAVDNCRGYDADFVIDLDIRTSTNRALTTQKIVNTKEFITTARDVLAGYKFVVYRPIKIPVGLSSDRFIANDLSYGRFEDKKIFRETFFGELPIPNYEIILLDNILIEKYTTLYEDYRRKFGERFVVQDNINSGGRGTFVISSPSDMLRALQVLAAESKGTHLIISEFIEGVERSIQVFVSDQHTVVGPLQQQLVKNPELLNPNSRGGIFFCGGRLIFNADVTLQKQLKEIIEATSGRLREEGYRGIFGIDFIVDANNKVYVIEVNARTTGLLPLLNEQEATSPLYLLHILELANESYKINANTTSYITPYTKLAGPVSFVTLFNTTDQDVYLSQQIRTGNYSYKNGILNQIDNKARWNSSADCMIQLSCEKDYPSKPNFKICNVFLKKGGFDDYGTLDKVTREIISYLKKCTIAKL